MLVIVPSEIRMFHNGKENPALNEKGRSSDKKKKSSHGGHGSHGVILVKYGSKPASSD